MALSVDLDYVKGFLGISDESDTYDTDIELLIPLYISEVTKDFELDGLSDDMTNILVAAVAGGIGCHLSKSRPAFAQGQNIKGLVVGKIEKTFDTKNKDASVSWCKYYESMVEEILSSMSETNMGTVKRGGISDDYSVPY